MKKKGLLLGMILTAATTVVAMPPGLQPPITGGAGSNASSTEVRITANVVETVAINEASPIDFGNLVKGVTGDITARTPGKIEVKGTEGHDIALKINVDKTTLNWTGANGTVETTPGTVDQIKDVKIEGLTTADAVYTLPAGGIMTKVLNAKFAANAGGNLGTNQRLGSYESSIIVTATKQ